MILTVLFIGFGAVATATTIIWPQILKTVKVRRLIAIEPRDLPRDVIRDLTDDVHHIKLALTRRNFKKTMAGLDAERIDLCIDVSIGVNSVAVMTWCTARGIPYISTAVEDWEDELTWSGATRGPAATKDIIERSLAFKQAQIRAKFPRGGPTLLIDHGMNPGLISHFIKRGLEVNRRQLIPGVDLGIEKMPDDAVNGPYYAAIAKALGVETIHCAEIDTQEPIKPRPADVFINTWSPKGFYEEATDPVQIGWGSHEQPIPGMIRWRGMAFLPRRGMDVQVKTYLGMKQSATDKKILVPYWVDGRLIPHSENSTIPDYLTLGAYRPSMYYVYRPSPICEGAFTEIAAHEYKFQPRWHVLRADEIKGGSDRITATFICRDRIMTYGLTLSDADAKKITHVANATTIQVAWGVCTGIDWLLANPGRGATWPESVNTDRVFDLVAPLIGDDIIGDHSIVGYPSPLLTLINH